MRAIPQGLLVWLILASNAVDQTATIQSFYVDVQACGMLLEEISVDSARMLHATSLFWSVWFFFFEERLTEHIKGVEGVGVGVLHKFDKK